MTTLSSGDHSGLSQINEEYEEDAADILMKKYENMSFEEMSKHMAESNKLMSEMLSTSTSMTSLHSTTDKEEEEEEEDPSKKWTQLFAKTASNGDIHKLKEMLADDSIRPFIDINAKDSDGTPPLIYAACFGKTDIARLLIEAGANVDAQDNFGWSALMWATNNSQEALVKILLDNGASSQTKSAKGRTVHDFVNTENQKMIDILATTPRDSMSSTSSSYFRTTSSVSSSTSSNDFYYQSTVEGYQQFVAEEAEIRQKLFDSTMAAFVDMETNCSSDEDQEEDLEDNNEFHWDKCSPDQMFVFNSDDLDYILDTMISNIQLPLANQQDIHIPANVIFLSARFAHYFSTPELLEQVLDGALNRIRKTIKANIRNIHALAFWTTNLTQLLFYLKKDTGLVIVTAEQQLHASELVSETYNMIIQDTEERLYKVLGPALLDHEEIQGMDQVDFADDWQRFFRKSTKRSVTNGNLPAVVSPQDVTSLLSSTLFVLQSYDVHPIIIVQAMAQLFHFISCEAFNRILTSKKLLCRSKAMQIRMNFSHLEDWVSVHRLPSQLSSYLTPTIQLLQLLQCLTQLRDLMDFINTTKDFDALNTPQVKRCVISYRYEVNEPKLPEEIEKYAIQCAEDTVRYRLKKQSAEKVCPPVSRLQQNPKLARRQSMSQYLGLTSRIPVVVEPSNSSPIKKNTSDEEDQSDGDEDIKEIKDTKFMLPFSVPTTAHMMDKHQENQPMNQMIPIIPEEWMDKLDKQNPVS